MIGCLVFVTHPVGVLALPPRSVASWPAEAPWGHHARFEPHASVSTSAVVGQSRSRASRSNGAGATTNVTGFDPMSMIYELVETIREHAVRWGSGVLRRRRGLPDRKVGSFAVSRLAVVQVSAEVASAAVDCRRGDREFGLDRPAGAAMGGGRNLADGVGSGYRIRRLVLVRLEMRPAGGLPPRSSCRPMS